MTRGGLARRARHLRGGHRHRQRHLRDRATHLGAVRRRQATRCCASSPSTTPRACSAGRPPAAVSDRCVYAGVVEHSVYVHPDAWGRGCGRLLLDALVELCERAASGPCSRGSSPRTPPASPSTSGAGSASSGGASASVCTTAAGVTCSSSSGAAPPPARAEPLPLRSPGGQAVAGRRCQHPGGLPSRRWCDGGGAASGDSRSASLRSPTSASLGLLAFPLTPPHPPTKGRRALG